MSKINGWLFVDKHVGITSRKIVDIISRSIKQKKVGHAGTLDPMASGLLAVAIGEATKTVFLIQNTKKIYEFKVRWGISTSTDDIEGQIISQSPIRPTKKEILSLIPKFIGDIEQRPPIYSAIKINGIRSYKIARQNKKVSHKLRSIIVSDLKLKKYIDEDHSIFEITCSKGTYVRSIARDLGKILNSEAHVVELRRKAIGKFSVKNAILLDLSSKLIHSPLILKNLISMKDILEVLPSINLTKEEAMKIKYGQCLRVNEIKNFSNFISNYPNYSEIESLYCTCNDIPIALLKINKNMIRPSKVFNV